jgi:hypothetical protein
MNKWKAYTASGAVYEYDDGFVTITPSPDSKLWPTVMRLHDMSISIAEEELQEGSTYGLPWTHPILWVRAEVPKVGHLLYVNGREEWRVSTPIVKVEEEA